MTINGQMERRARAPRLLDWLESEFPILGQRGLERVPAIRCEQFVEDGTYVLRAELPGFDPEKDVDVRVHNGVLIVHAERREEQKDDRRSEFYYGEVERSLTLPEGVDTSAVTATYKQGILEIRVPMPEQPAPEARKVPVQTAD